MKNKKMLIYGSIALAIGAGAFFYFRKKKNDEVDMSSVDSSPLPNPPAKVQESNNNVPSKRKTFKNRGLGSNNSNSGTLEEVSVTKDRKPIFGERIQQGVDPRIDEAMKNRDEAERVRKAKGIGDARWWGEMMGQKLTTRQQLFMKYKQSNATSDEMLSASTTMLNWAKNR